MTRIVTLEDIDNAYTLGRTNARQDWMESDGELNLPENIFEEHDPMEVVLIVTGEKDVDEADLILSAYEDGYEDGYYGEQAL